MFASINQMKTLLSAELPQSALLDAEGN